MPTKFKIKMGHVEFEYEGDAQFDKDAIKDLFSHMESLIGKTPTAAFDPPVVSGRPADAGNTTSEDKFNKLAVNTVAARLGVKSGTDMAIAAAVHIQLVAGKESFTRKDLLDSMQGAKTYYKATMGSNLTKSLNVLIASNRINSLTNSEMSLSANELAAAKAKLIE